MEISIKGTKTEKNLAVAFTSETHARVKYDFFAKIAKKEGYEQIGAFFSETALHEERHAKTFYAFFEDGNIDFHASFAFPRLGNTLENLRHAAKDEKDAFSFMYPEFGKIADNEGLKEIAVYFRLTAKIEEQHYIRFQNFIHALETNTVFEQETEVNWLCRKCGYVTKGTKPPEICPACKHPKGYFEVLAPC